MDWAGSAVTDCHCDLSTQLFYWNKRKTEIRIMLQSSINKSNGALTLSNLSSTRYCRWWPNQMDTMRSPQLCVDYVNTNRCSRFFGCLHQQNTIRPICEIWQVNWVDWQLGPIIESLVRCHPNWTIQFSDYLDSNPTNTIYCKWNSNTNDDW